MEFLASLAIKALVGTSICGAVTVGTIYKCDKTLLGFKDDSQHLPENSGTNGGGEDATQVTGKEKNTVNLGTEEEGGSRVVAGKTEGSIGDLGSVTEEAQEDPTTNTNKEGGVEAKPEDETNKTEGGEVISESGAGDIEVPSRTDTDTTDEEVIETEEQSVASRNDESKQGDASQGD